jgi:hypothetical protein
MLAWSFSDFDPISDIRRDGPLQGAIALLAKVGVMFGSA